MIERMSPARQRFLAIALLVIVVTGAMSVTALPLVLANVHYQDDIEQLQERLLRLRQISAQDDELRQQYADLRRAQSSRGYFLKGDSETIASADLQRILKRISASNGTQLVSTQQLPATSENNLTRISLRVRVQGPLTGLVESMYALESNSVLLFLDNLSLRQTATRRLRVPAHNQSFEASFDLIAYMSEIS